LVLKGRKVSSKKINQNQLAIQITQNTLKKNHQRILQKTVKKKNLTLQKERKSFLKEMMLEHFLIPITQNISVKNEQIIHQEMVKEKNLILKRARKNLKIEADPSLLSLKNIKEIGTN